MVICVECFQQENGLENLNPHNTQGSVAEEDETTLQGWENKMWATEQHTAAFPLPWISMLQT